MQIHELNNFNGTPGATNFLAIDDGSDTSKISGEALLDPVNSRIDNLTANVLPDSVETILDWADVESASKTLTKNVSGFDYLDLYFKENTSGTNRIVFAQRYPRTAFPAQVTIPVISWGGGTDPKYLYFQDLMIAISGTTLTMSQLRIYSWDGKAADGANIETGILVDQIRVDGVKISSNTSAELTDLRTAHNGTVYASARAAREADYNALNGEITDVKSNFNDIASLNNVHYPIAWEHGGIDNATGATNNNGSLVRSRDVHYYKVSDFFSITNKAGGALWIIFYTESGGTYTFASSQSVSVNNSYYFDLPSISNYYFRLDCRDGLSGAEQIELIYTTKLVDGLIFESYNEIPQKENLFDKNAVTSGSYIRSTDGHIGTSAGYFASDYIPVKKGVTYYTGGFYSSYTALYDLSKKFLSGNVISGANYLGTFTPTEDGYFRGTVTNSNFLTTVYVSPYKTFFTEYDDVDYSVASKFLLEENCLNARGETSPNHFAGSCYYGQFNSGVESFSYNQIITDFIPIQGTAFYKLFNGKAGDITTIVEYDSAKNYIDRHTLSGKTIGYRILDGNTRFVRFATMSTSESYTLPDPVEMSQNLLVTNDIKVLGRLATNHNITGQESVRYDLFDKSVAFEKSYVKSAIETYRDTLRDTFYDFVMPMNTDLHTVDSEPYNMLTYMADSGMADICFNLGDNVPDHFDTRKETVEMLEAVRLWNQSNCIKCPLIALRGNHDNNPVNDMDVDKMIPDALYYNIMQNRTHKGFYKAGLNYGFLDFEQSKIRVIWLDSGDIYNHTTGEPLTSGYNVMVQQDQFDWFCNVALDFSNIADRDEWSVITVSHAQISAQLSTAFAVVLKAFMDGTSASGSVSTAYGDYTNTLTYNVDYSSQGVMEYICHVNGHTHDDTASLIGNTGRYDIDIACDNGTAYYYVGSTRTAYTRTAGTIEEHIMDTLCLDKTSRKIYMKRLGVGSDREFSY